MDIDVALVRSLIAAQFPQWAHLPVRPVGRSGWDNRTFRLGDELSVRLPSAEGYVPAVEKEQRWLPYLAPRLPVPIPVPAGRGVPGAGYPYPWSVYRWIEGTPVDAGPVFDLLGFATDLAGFLVALRAVDPAGGPAAGPHSFWRGGPLEVYDAETRQAIALLATGPTEPTPHPPSGAPDPPSPAPAAPDTTSPSPRAPDTAGPGRGAPDTAGPGPAAIERDEPSPAVRALREGPWPVGAATRATAIWAEALAATWTGPPVWFHGDVAEGNLLLRDGRLAAVIDFGTCGIGDPASDLRIAWTLFDGESRAAFRDAVDQDEATWARATGWTLWKALITAHDPGSRRVLAELLRT
jgi:aminoglycoside phosphotransferase (APT) family kinase protein